MHAGKPAGSSDPADPHPEHPPDDLDRPQTRAAFSLHPAQARALHLKTAAVRERDFVRQIRTVGVLVVDETRTSRIHTKIDGFIETIAVDFVGQRVRRGEPLCTIYSQEVYAAQIDYLAVLEQSDTVPPESALAETWGRTIAAARRRLLLWDIPEREVRRIEQERRARRTFTLVSPRSGTVVSKQAIEGAYVDRETELYTITDLSRVWALVDIYEQDVPYVARSQLARLHLEGLGKTREARVSFVHPTLDEATRTLRVRFELDNPDGRLRPGTFVTAELEADVGRGLAVPRDAVIRTGRRDIVFVVHDLHVEPREIVLGPLVGDHYRVDEGLRPGEHVATGGQFLLDAESQIREVEAPHVH